MPPRRTPGSGQRTRRRLVCLALVLAAAGITTYRAVGGGGGSIGAHAAADAPQAAAINGEEAGAGGVRGNEAQPNKGYFGAKAVGPAGGKAAGAGNPPPQKKPEGEVAAAALPTRKGKGVEVFEETEDGGFLVKVGQIRVKTSESLDFSTEDAVPGSIWLPIALRDVPSGDPWVTMCLIDYQHYQDNPSSTPMFAYLSTYSKCGNKRKDDSFSTGLVAVVRMSSLLKSMADEGSAPLPPKGFIYHETRCGSTLVANMLATLAPSRVFSESKPPTQTIRECLTAGCDRQLLVKMFRNMMALMGRRRKDEQHEHLYFKFQNSKFVSHISEAYPEVPWVFVFRDPVEVMVSNLKSYAGAPCVRIPRQEKLRQQAARKFRTVGGGGDPAVLKSKAAARDAALRETRPKFGRERGGDPRVWRGPKGVRGGENRARGLVEAGVVVLGGSAPGEGVTATANGVAGRGGGEGDAFSEIDTGMAVWEEEEVEEGGSSLYASVSWSGDISGGIESSDLPLYPAFHSSAALFEPSPWESAALGAGEEERRSLAAKKKTNLVLTANMTMECANWLQDMCVFALEAEKETPSKALFVDYANLPDAVPEHVFPQHFGMEAEVARTVPDWKDRMFKAAGSYSKGMGTRSKEFTNDVKAKHQNASPLIVEASEKDGGLYEVYRSLETMQSWRRPDSEGAPP